MEQLSRLRFLNDQSTWIVDCDNLDYTFLARASELIEIKLGQSYYHKSQVPTFLSPPHTTPHWCLFSAIRISALEQIEIYI